MPKSIDRTGHRYGRLVVLGPAEPSYTPKGYKLKRWHCQCDCGNKTTVLGTNLASGSTIACGCAQRDAVSTHGLRNHPLYDTWRLMIRRCYDPKTQNFEHYGGRGIGVCAEWKESVEAFIRDMAPKPSAVHSLERIDNAKDYGPDNCRWADQREQTRNKRNNIWLTVDGERLVLVDAARKVGLDPQLVYTRVHRGWPVEHLLLPKGTRLSWVGANLSR